MNFNRNFEFQKQKARSHYPNQTAQSVFDSQNLVSLTSVMLYHPSLVIHALAGLQRWAQFTWAHARKRVIVVQKKRH